MTRFEPANQWSEVQHAITVLLCPPQAFQINDTIKWDGIAQHGTDIDWSRVYRYLEQHVPQPQLISPDTFYLSLLEDAAAYSTQWVCHVHTFVLISPSRENWSTLGRPLIGTWTTDDDRRPRLRSGGEPRTQCSLPPVTENSTGEKVFFCY